MSVHKSSQQCTGWNWEREERSFLYRLCGESFENNAHDGIENCVDESDKNIIFAISLWGKNLYNYAHDKNVKCG